MHRTLPPSSSPNSSVTPSLHGPSVNARSGSLAVIVNTTFSPAFAVVLLAQTCAVMPFASPPDGATLLQFALILGAGSLAAGPVVTVVLVVSVVGASRYLSSAA